MASSPQGSMSAKAQEAMGLPAGMKQYSPFPFGGMNVQSSPIALDDKEFTWIENWLRLGDGNLRTAWDVGPALYSSGDVVNYFFYTIGTTDYCIIFLQNGSAIQIDANTGAQTSITHSLPFYLLSEPGNLPFAKTWGTQYLVISNNNTTNDYWIWDGALLYFSGSIAPAGAVLAASGFNYSTVPAYTVFGGSGSGMTLTPVVNNGGLVNLTIDSPGSGYQIGDLPQVAFSGGGSDTSPILTAALSTGSVGAVVVSAAGTGYTSATVAFSGGGGTGAAGTVIISTGVTSVPITAAGSGYTYATGSFSGGGGTGATCTITLTGGSVTDVIVTNPGSGYTSAPTFTFGGVSGTGATFGTVTIAGGLISGVSITNPGSGYTTAPAVAFSGTGSGASGSSLLAPVGVASVTVVNGGTGFKSVPLITFLGGGGAGATGVVLLTPTSVATVNLTAGGSGYGVAPTVAFTGGNGSGATAHAVLNGDVVSQIVVTNGGSGYTGPIEVVLTSANGDKGAGAGGTVVYNATSIASVTVSSTGQFYTSAPAVVVSPGANNAAYATVALMPYGVSGSAFETYLSRIWIVDPATSLTSTTPPGGLWSVSAPGSLTDFATSDGGAVASNTDAFLQTKYTNIRQSSGYLYFYGDGSVSVVSNVSTSSSSGSSVTTVYNYQNVDPQAGAEWRDTLQDFGRSAILANATGVYGLYGGTTSKISQKLDQLFTPVSQGGLFVSPNEGGVTPTSAIATIFNTKHFLLLLTIQDPDLGTNRNVMLTWNEKEWTVTSQSVNLTSITTQKVGSNYVAYGSDGTKIYPLFATPSATLSKRFDTKQYGADRMFVQKQAYAVWMQAQDNSFTGGVTGTFTLVTSGIGIQNARNPSGQSLTSSAVFNIQPNFEAPYPYWPLWGTSTGGIYFVTAALRFETSAPDFTLGNLVFGYGDKVAYFGQ